jgi:hypothetical protein
VWVSAAKSPSAASFSRRSSKSLRERADPGKLDRVDDELVFGAAGTHGRAVSRGIRFAIYTAPLFTTTIDAENRANVAATPTAALDLVGLGLHAIAKSSTKLWAA